jgi:hypothetical protein
MTNNSIYTKTSQTDYVASGTGMTTVVYIGLALIGTGTLYDMSYKEKWRDYLQSRVSFSIDTAGEFHVNETSLDSRTVAEHIENIDDVLDPQISDLAVLFDVSRQSIYKWQAGTLTPDTGKLERIIQVSHIADAFRKAGISRAGTLFKIKMFNNLSLLELVKKGEHSDRHVSMLIEESKVMKALYKRSGMSSSKTKPTEDWKSYISIPGSLEHA